MNLPDQPEAPTYRRADMYQGCDDLDLPKRRDPDFLGGFMLGFAVAAFLWMLARIAQAWIEGRFP